MSAIHTLIIGGGQAGLAMSRCLAERGVEHVVLERGRVAERWRSERWDSLRLLTPNWQTRLPGYRYGGSDPDGYLTMPEVVSFFDEYARAIAAPVETGTTVTSVERAPAGFRIQTDRGEWMARQVVVATGYCDVPAVPSIAAGIGGDVLQLAPTQYRRPAALPPGAVLIVGAAASGLQLADEIRAAGRDVVLSVGRHLRLPRCYRGRDILWWMDRMGIFDETTEDVFDPRISREQPSLQLVGRPDRSSLDVGHLRRRGVRLVGRLAAIENGRAYFDDDLIATSAGSDVKLARLLERIDAFAATTGLATAEAEPFAPLWPLFADTRETSNLDLRTERIGTVIWATGFRRRYPWLRVPVLDACGEIRHYGGVTDVPGLYVLGLQFMRRRKSAFIDGVGDDAVALASHMRRGQVLLHQFLHGLTPASARAAPLRGHFARCASRGPGLDSSHSSRPGPARGGRQPSRGTHGTLRPAARGRREHG